MNSVNARLKCHAFLVVLCVFFSSRRRHTSFSRDWSSDVCSSDLTDPELASRLDGGGRAVEEKLLIAEREGQAEVALYVEAGVVERLSERDPLRRLDE